MEDAQRYRQALERLALPMAFGLPKMTDEEDRARMAFAQFVLNGYSVETAEREATEQADRELREKHQRFLKAELKAATGAA